MAQDIIMPQLGESIAEGTIVKWLKNAGDAVKKDENILLISTDKVEAEIPSPSAGVLLEILVEPGKTVAVGTLLGRVGEAHEQASGKKVQSAQATESGGEPEAKPAKPDQNRQEKKPEREAGPASPASSEIPGTSPEGTKPEGNGDSDMASFYSPLVRKIATENRIGENELSTIAGTGRGGRVSKNDVLQYLENRPRQSAQETRPAFKPASPSPSPLQLEIASNGRELTKPISTMRRVIMENMVASRSKSAHVTTFFEIDYTAIDKVREKHKEEFKKQEQVSLTYTTFLAAALCQVLKRHPYINATLTNDAIVFKKDIHLGIAVAIEKPEPGLMVPVIKNADMQNLRGLAHAIADLGGRVRDKKIKPDELSGGTFTITNPGNYGAVIGTPIINQPQVAILGVGHIKKHAVVLEMDGTDMIAIRRTGLLSLSFDHRLIDGATADAFMADLKHTLESWTQAP